MLKIAEHKNELILRDYPVLSLILGAAIIGFSMMLLSVQYDFLYQSLSGGKFGFGEVIGILVTITMFIGGFLLIFKSPIITTIINRELKTLTTESKSLLKYDYRNFRFSQIESSLSVKTTTQKTTYYTPQIKVISTGEAIDVTHNGFSRPGKAYEIVDLANQYLADDSDKDNFKLTIFNDD